MHISKLGWTTHLLTHISFDAFNISTLAGSVAVLYEMLSLHVHLCYRCCGCAHRLYSVDIIRGCFSWQNADESGQMEVKTSKAETLDQAATVMVVSEHSIHSM